MKRKISPRQREALKLIAEGRFYPVLVEEEDGWYARWSPLENPWIDEYVRRAAISPLSEDAEDQVHETLHDAWIMALRSRTGRVNWNVDECREFAADLVEWAGNAEDDVDARGKVVFRLVMPSSDDDSPRLECDLPHGLKSYRALGQATFVWGKLRGLRRQMSKLTLSLTLAEAEDFVQRGSRSLVNAGYGVEGVVRSVEVTAAAEISETKRIKLTVKVAGEAVNAAEIRFLLDQGSSLVFFRDRWIEVNRSILRNALRALEHGVGKRPNLMAFALGIGHVGQLEIDELKAHGWIRGLLEEFRRRGKSPVTELAEIPGFNGVLRDYQKRGVEWLSFMTSHGFGALLADDMGLGKTIETIAWILADRAAHTPCLIVTPLTLIANWRHELRAFAPSLSEKEVVVVNYHRLIREYSRLSSIPWKSLVVDEAQFVKNSETRAAKSIRALSPVNRIALTGTPIENSVQDVWALEDFLNPGFLGDRASFRERFLRPLARNPQSAVGTKLKRALEPFVLRRLKSDPQIAAELGEKRITREYCILDNAARQEYEMALSDYRVQEHTPGDAFALLTRLKQICDGQGKIQRLLELLTSIFEAGESALVFTQYAQVGFVLQKAMSERFRANFPYLHGTLSAAERERQIAAFERGARMPDYSPRQSAFVLSLKTGGFGLNLTKATHVIHFDRWWNPAVEDQATDRAHRIGQRHPVLVHLFITTATLEERIDEMLERKESLQGIIADGEAFYKMVQLTT